MKIKRMWWTIRLFLTWGGEKRTSYARKQRIYAQMGENVYIQSRVVPLYSELISFHNNITIARNVDFCTHDVIHGIFNRLAEEEKLGFKFSERIGCIEIMDNVFVGSNSTVLYDVRIGPNVIIASGSVVTRDCEPNSVYAGVPARKIGTFDDFLQKRICEEKKGLIAFTHHNQMLTDEEIERAWKIFEMSH